MVAVVANKGLGHARPPGRAPIGLQHDTQAIGPKTVTQQAPGQILDVNFHG